MLLTQLELNREITQVYACIYQKRCLYEVTLQHFIYLRRVCFNDWKNNEFTIPQIIVINQL